MTRRQASRSTKFNISLLRLFAITALVVTCAGHVLAADPPLTGSTDTATAGLQVTSNDGSGLSEPGDDGGRGRALMASLTIFVLAIFVGFEIITKVPPTLHTPLMSGSNAISGIALVGAVIVTGTVGGMPWLGMLAVAFATVNVVGGFLVTHRMLAMFARPRSVISKDN